MGCVYDRNKSRPELGPNIYVRFKGPTGKWVSRPVGKVKPAGLTKAQLRRRTKELMKLAGDVLARIEGDIMAGRYDLEDASRPRPEKDLFKKVVTAWVDARQEANRLDPDVHRAWKDEKSRIKCHLIPFFGQMEVRAVTTAQVCEFIATKRGKLKRQTIINCLNVISRMYNDLREAHQDVQNPVASAACVLARFAPSSYRHRPHRPPLQPQRPLRRRLPSPPPPLRLRQRRLALRRQRLDPLHSPTFQLSNLSGLQHRHPSSVGRAAVS